MNDFYVVVIRYKNNKIAGKMGPMSELKARRVESGANINLNHEEFYTLVLKESELSGFEEE
jgi:hypothetical protein